MGELGHILMNMPIRYFMYAGSLICVLIAAGFFAAWLQRR